MKVFTTEQWNALFSDQKHYVNGIPMVYSWVRGIGTVWVPVWFSDVPGTSQPMGDALMAEVKAVHGLVELWFTGFHGTEGNEKNVQHLGYHVVTYGHPAWSGPGEKDVKAEHEGGVLATSRGGSVIYPATKTGLKDALDWMKREIERRGGNLHGKTQKEAASKSRGTQARDPEIDRIEAEGVASLKAKALDMKVSAAGLLKDYNLVHLARDPGRNALGEEIFTYTSDGRKVSILYAGPFVGRIGDETRIVILYWLEKKEYSTHSQDKRTNEFHFGHYFQSYKGAISDYEARTGTKHPLSGVLQVGNEYNLGD